MHEARTLFAFAYEFDGTRYCRRLTVDAHLRLPMRLAQMFAVMERELHVIESIANSEPR